MRVITKRDMIREVAKAWRACYGLTPGRPISYGKDRAAILTQLEALDMETCTDEEVIRITGNEAWTEIRCTECDGSVSAVIEIGEEYCYESDKAHLCFECVGKAHHEALMSTKVCEHCKKQCRTLYAERKKWMCGDCTATSRSERIDPKNVGGIIKAIDSMTEKDRQSIVECWCQWCGAKRHSCQCE